MKFLVLNVTEGTGFSVIEAQEGHGLDVYYDALECSTFDIVERKIGGVWFDIFCDDDGLFVEKPILSALVNNSPALVGNLLFAHHDREGNTTGLTDEEIELIKANGIDFFDPLECRMWTAVSCTL